MKILRSTRNRKGEVNILTNNLEPWWFNALVAHKISFYHWIKRRHQGQLEYMMKTFMAGIKKQWEKHNITSHPESIKDQVNTNSMFHMMAFNRGYNVYTELISKSAA